jgi:SNF family Na+-dependent transporter
VVTSDLYAFIFFFTPIVIAALVLFFSLYVPSPEKIIYDYQKSHPEIFFLSISVIIFLMSTCLLLFKRRIEFFKSLENTCDAVTGTVVGEKLHGTASVLHYTYAYNQRFFQKTFRGYTPLIPKYFQTGTEVKLFVSRNDPSKAYIKEFYFD